MIPKGIMSDNEYSLHVFNFYELSKIRLYIKT